MVNCCEAGAAEPRGDLLAGWHAAKQAWPEATRGHAGKVTRGQGAEAELRVAGGGWQQGGNR